MSDKLDSKKIWKSLDAHHEDPEVLKEKLNEFKEGVTDDFDPDSLNKVSRRKFLAILAASSAYAATACTSYRDKGEIVPYLNRPEEILPGKPTYYASSFYDEGISYGILVKTREGRPIKIEGNSDDPINRGKIPSKAHASILNLYDPERIKEPRIGGSKVSWKKINQKVQDTLINVSDQGKEIALLVPALTSPTTQKVINDFMGRYPTSTVHTVQLVTDTNKVVAWKNRGGGNIIPSIKLDKAKTIVSIESDFLGKEGNTTENKILYAKSRDIVGNNELSKLYTIEAGMSLTGMNSDIRLRLKPQLQFEFLLGIINELVKLGAISSSKLDGNLSALVDKISLDKFGKNNELDISKLKELAADLSNNSEQSIIIGGDILPSETHMLINIINELLGNSNLYDYDNGFINISEQSDAKDISDLIKKIKNEDVGVVIHFDSNPVYDLAPEFGYSEAIKNLENVISLSEFPNETTNISKYIVPISNILESWGDHQTRNGQLTLQQPVISPIFDTRQKESILLDWIYPAENTEERYQEYLKSSIKNEIYEKGEYGANFENFWNTALHDGIILQSPLSNSNNNLDQFKIVAPISKTGGLTLILQNNYYFGTGKYSNNGWLQELPHPVTKVTWDNFAAISPATAEKNDLGNDDLINISSGSREIELPVMVQPGMADDVIVTELGYGRLNSGEVADGVGFNVNSIRSNDSLSNFIIDNVTISKTGEEYKLASTQEHHSLDDDFVKDFHRLRKIIQEGTIEEYKNNPHFLHENKHDIFSITESHEYKNEKWAMSIDLNKCLGCSECISSCNVENNVPIVGKEQVALGREMQWMRIDRYYSGTPEEPIVSTQPMLCQHCDNAPCENVCPVNATNHSPDGLNQMAYNRCVGTRYCANNCPYKVRRFNFYNFRDNFADAHYDNELTYLVNNPEVTVRSRGVIEKCSFCVQNIMEVRETAIKEGREIKADEVTTSCQNACPADAIVFGDSNNEESTVFLHRKHDLSYHVLEELNIKPNVTYLAKIRNTRTEDS